MSVDDERVGFELDGEFVELAFNANHGKDLMLIDRIAAMPVDEFIDEFEAGSGRSPVMLTLLATSLRAKHPDWSVDRIYRLVTDDLSDLSFIGGKPVPPAEAPDEGANGQPIESSSDGSSGSSTLPEPSEAQPTFG